MYNLRYHIVSIVAVFLALALGLVLGGLIGGNSGSSLQKNLADNIVQKVNQISDENAKVNAENQHLTAFGTDSLALLSKDRLTGSSVLVIGAQGDASKHAIQVLQEAGALVTVADINASRYKADNKNLASVKLVNNLKTHYKQTNDLDALAAGFAAEWSRTTTATAESTAQASARPVTAALQSDGILKLSGDVPTTTSLDGVIDVALGDKDAPDSFGLKLAQAFDKQNTPTIIAQMSDTTSTLGQTAAGMNLGVTDLFGTPMGDWTVIAVLDGTAPRATYGTLDGADQIYPPLK